MGNFWSSNSYWYYLWSSFKGMEFMHGSGIAPDPGNLGPDDLGTLPPDASCAVRQMHRDPATLPRVTRFGADGVGYYNAESQSQYFDYAYTILSHQGGSSGGSGEYNANGAPGRWNNYARQAYALLVLQRATGGACIDSDNDGVCDEDDNCPATPNPNQEDQDGDGVGDVCDNCVDVFNPGQEDSNGNGVGDACEASARCDVDSDGDIDRTDIRSILRARNQPASGPDDPRDADGDGIITGHDAKLCIIEMRK